MDSRTERFGLVLTPRERTALVRLAEAEERTQAAIIRALIRRAARERGIWPTTEAQQPQEVRHA